MYHHLTLSRYSYWHTGQVTRVLRSVRPLSNSQVKDLPTAEEITLAVAVEVKVPSCFICCSRLSCTPILHIVIPIYVTRLSVRTPYSVVLLRL